MTYQAPELVLIGAAHNLVLGLVTKREQLDNIAGLLASRNTPTL
jgi:hypothetical protein